MKQRSRSVVRTAASVTDLHRTSPRRARWLLPVLAALIVAAASGAQPAFAQGKLEAQYEATLAGIPVGRGAWNIEISDDQFPASAVGGTAGLLKSFSSSSGTGSAPGRVVHGGAGAHHLKDTVTELKRNERD